MAELQNRLPENIPGAYYVTDDCIDCDMCRENAPTVFHRHDDIAFSTVYHQPTSPEEVATAEAALEGCPVEAIGNDGGTS